ncbi:hypothetical protein LSCM4_01952 [Leishmania orientalis]|uniref:SUN domain-containing protein n=1 Tax=Leishmania orientalis TaxID=2249476 RepID=A0A836G084_9TRYP|nr:hypothetical protein LSCM4_01952 [Leishmania orientalis]
MQPEERLVVLGALMLLLCILFSAPLELLSVGGHRNSSAAAETASLSPLKRIHRDLAPGLSTNYASLYLGATVVSTEPPSCQGGSALISDSADKYVLCPCDAPRKQFVVQLIRDVEVRAVMVRNAEHFSSGVRNFTLLGSLKYPTSTWFVLGRFEAEQRRGRQYFDVAPCTQVRFIKLQWATSYGPEPWCTITSFQVYGIDALETLTRFDEENLEAGEDVFEFSGGLRGSPGMDRFHRKALPSTQEDVTVPSAAGSRAAPPMSSATPAIGAPLAPASIDELAAGIWDGATAAAKAPRGVEPDGLLMTPMDIAVSADAGPPFQPDADAKQPSSSNAIVLAATASAIQSPSWCAGHPISWNASLQCTASRSASLWGPCASATCGASDVTAVTAPAGVSASSVSTARSKGLSPSKSLYQSAAASLLTQLLRQQRSMRHELMLLTQRERYMAQELNRTRALISDIYKKYKGAAMGLNEYRGQMRELQVEIRALHERFLRERRSSFDQGDGTGGGGRSTMRDGTAMAAAACALFALTAVLVLIASSSSSKGFVGSPSRWGRSYSISRGGGGPPLG